MSGIVNSAGSRSGVIGTTELDYEEGEFAPHGTNITYNYTGHYQKIGNWVTCTCDVRGSASSTEADIGGLPFTSSAGNAGGGTVTKQNSTAQAGEVLSIYVKSTDTHFNIVLADVSKTFLINETVYCEFTYKIA